MATVKKSPDEVAAEGGQAQQDNLGTGGGGGSDLGASAGGAQIKSPQTGTGFTNVSEYLDANKEGEKKNEEAVGGQYEKKYNTVKSGVDSAAQGAISGIGARTEDNSFRDEYDRSKAEKDQEEFKKNQSTAEEWYRNQKANVRGMARSAREGGGRYLSQADEDLLQSDTKAYREKLDNEQRARSQAERDKAVAGLTTRYKYTNDKPNADITGVINPQISQFGQDLGRLNTSEGAQGVVSEMNHGRAGLSALDSALLQRGGGAKNITEKYGNLNDYLTQAQGGISQAQAARNAEQQRALTDSELEANRRIGLRQFNEANHH
jgi:hypothetical protein